MDYYNIELMKNHYHILKQIILIYENKFSNKKYIELGEVVSNNNTVWKPIENSKFYLQLKRNILNNIKINEHIKISTSNTLYFNEDLKKLIFYLNPGKRLLIFTFIKKPILIPLPGLLFIVNNNTIKVFAFKKKGRPNKNTIFYNAPLPNGSCMGNVKISFDYNNTIQQLIDLVIHYYFNSKFTNENLFQAIKNFNDNEIEIYTDLSKLDKFPNKLLKNPKKILAE
jgi:PRTRC genetic system protein B